MDKLASWGFHRVPIADTDTASSFPLSGRGRIMQVSR
jgi:hypothetical protein